MEDKSFLPDGSTVRSRLLARAPYTQDVMERIASDENPASLARPSATDGTWGVLYVSDSGAGFFSARSTPAMFGFSLDSGANEIAPIHLAFPAGPTTSIETVRAKRLPGKLGALLSRIVASESVATVRWQAADGPREIMFFVTNGDLDDFERAFRAING